MIDLHTTGTANGYKASIMLEETGLPYRVIDYDLVRATTSRPSNVAITPVARMPAIVDHDVPGGGPVSVWDGGDPVLPRREDRALLPADPRTRATVYEWVGVVSSDIGPAYSGQFAFNVIAPEKIPFAIQFTTSSARGWCRRFEVRLGQAPYLAGDEYTIADMIAYPVGGVDEALSGELDAHPNLARWAAVGARSGAAR